MNYNEMVYVGIVLYNPSEEKLKKNISAALNQISKIVLVDNGSSNIENVSEQYKDRSQITIIRNNKNTGIAYALNQIIKWGVEHNFEWCITLDQDSCMTEQMVEKLIKHSSNKQIGLICPRIYDINQNADISDGENSCGSSQITKSTDVITSGSCIRISAAVSIGGFDERLFIDYVDCDFNERLLRNGYVILQENSTKLIHEIGHFQAHRLFLFNILCCNHSAFRRYYMTRNRLYFRRKYFGRFSYITEKFKCILAIIKCLIYEDDKINKVKASIMGMKDYYKLWKTSKK